MKYTVIYCDICGKKINEDYAASIYLKKCNTSLSKNIDLCEYCLKELEDKLNIKRGDYKV